MLGKTKNSENDTPVAVPKKEEEKSAPASPRPTPRPSEEKTTIGERIFIEGQIKGEEHLVIEGEMKGNIQMGKHNFTVGSSGRVDGEIRAQNVSISGQLKGSIDAFGKVEVTKEADFCGDIKAKSISIEEGAYFKGSVELAREPHRKSNFAATPKGPPSPAGEKPAFSQPIVTKKEP